MICFFSLLLFNLPNFIDLPPTATILTATQDRVFCFDSMDERLWVLGPQEGRLETKIRKGWGPGEFQRPTGAAYFEGTLYLADLQRQTVSLFGPDLKFIKEFQVQGFPRSILVHKSGVFLLLVDPLHKSLITKFDFNFKPVAYFGNPVETLNHQTQTESIQNGSLFLMGDHLVFVHLFQPVVYVYGVDGKLVKKIQLPGLKESDLWSEDPGDPLPTFHGRMRCLQESPTQLRIGVLLGDPDQNPTIHKFLVDVTRFEVSKPTGPPKGHFLAGRFYERQEKEDRILWVAVGEKEP